MEASVEARLHELEERIARLEAVVSASAPAPKPFPTRATPPAPAPRREAPPPRQQLDFEDLLGGRVLAWVGGSAIVIGVVFFLALAINHGWIDRPTRVVLAFAGSSALLGAGLWLYERKGKTQAALAAMGAAIAALYASETAATTLYHLVPVPLGLAVAGLIGVVATAVAVRWDSRVVAGIGVIGALLAPVFVDAGTSGASLAFMAVALVSAVGILLWRRWNWLAGLAYLVSLPQLADWVYETRSGHELRTLAVVAAFWALYVVAALGFELRVPTAKLRISSALLLLANAAATAGIGWAVLENAGDATAAKGWVIGLAAAHVVLGVWGLRARISSEIGALLVAIGAALAAIGLAVVLEGPALVAGYAAEAALLAFAARRTGDVRGHIGAAVFVALAVGHVLVFEAPPIALATGVDSLPRAVVGLMLAIAASLACAAALGERNAEWSRGLVGGAAVLSVYLGSVAIVDLSGASEATGHTQAGQLLLSAFWAVTGFGALVAGLLRDRRELRLGGLALLAIVVLKVFVADLAALQSVYRVGSFVGLGLLLLAGAFAYQRIRSEGRS